MISKLSLLSRVAKSSKIVRTSLFHRISYSVQLSKDISDNQYHRKTIFILEKCKYVRILNPKRI